MNWYPRYAGDYIQDTGDLSLAEHGAYALLMDHCYGAERALENDPTSWYRICRAFTSEEQAAVRKVVGRFFPADGDGKCHNKRIAKELAKRKQICDKRRDAGKRGAKTRWDTEPDGGKNDGKCHNQNMANATTPTSTSTVTAKDTKKDSRKSRDLPTTSFEIVDLLKDHAKKHSKVFKGDRPTAANTIRLMVDKDGLSYEQIKSSLERYIEKFTGGQYEPEIFSAASFREKWNKLESFLKRSDGNNLKMTSDPTDADYESMENARELFG